MKLFKDTIRKKLLWHHKLVAAHTGSEETAPMTTGGTTGESPQVSVTDQRRPGHSKMTEQSFCLLVSVEFPCLCVCECACSGASIFVSS